MISPDSCPDCIAELDHCHGALVLHGDGTVECSDPDCLDLRHDRHDLVVVLSGVAEG